MMLRRNNFSSCFVQKLSTPIVLEMVHPILTKAILQPAKAAPIHTAPPPTSPYLTFLLAQDLSSK